MQQLLDVSVQWLDASAVSVNSPDTFRALSYRLTNTGNGVQSYDLSRVDAALGGSFQASQSPGANIYLETGNQLGFQASGPLADAPYNTASPVNLAPGASVIVYVLSHIPAGTAIASTANQQLVAVSNMAGVAGAATGTILSGAGVGGVDVVVAKPSATAQGAYIVSNLSTQILKTIANVRDPLGGTLIMSGAELEYQIEVKVSGQGTLIGFILTDPLPAALKYKANTLKINNIAVTDLADSDAGEVVGQTLTVRIPILNAPSTQVISFKVLLD